SSSQDKRTPEREEEIGKDGTVWTVVGEAERRGRYQSQNVLTEAQGPTTYKIARSKMPRLHSSAWWTPKCPSTFRAALWLRPAEF
ncbi:hypothetical protein ILYODFUR_009984, partial [Ilyodon furcidens]